MGWVGGFVRTKKKTVFYTLRVQTPPKKKFWGDFGGLNPFSGGTWTLRDRKKERSKDFLEKKRCGSLVLLRSLRVFRGFFLGIFHIFSVVADFVRIFDVLK